MDDECYGKEVLEDGIVIFRLWSLSHDCVDRWYRDISILFVEALRKDRPVRLLYDVQRLTMVTPYFIRSTQKLADLPLPDDWRVATLLRHELAVNIYRFVRSSSLGSRGLSERSEMFDTEESALAWLRQP